MNLVFLILQMMSMIPLIILIQHMYFFFLTKIKNNFIFKFNKIMWNWKW